MKKSILFLLAVVAVTFLLVSFGDGDGRHPNGASAGNTGSPYDR